VEQLLSDSERLLVELGPGSALRQLVGARVVSLLGNKGNESELEEVLRGVAKLWLEGVGVKWEELWRGERRHRVKLPAYPFERVRCWIDADHQINKVPEQTNPEHPVNPVLLSEDDLIQQQLHIMSQQLELLRQS
jgi:acyl transferase domain-containing protein